VFPGCLEHFGGAVRRRVSHRANNPVAVAFLRALLILGALSLDPMIVDFVGVDDCAGADSVFLEAAEDFAVWRMLPFCDL
jgi:hypothetical protein